MATREGVYRIVDGPDDADLLVSLFGRGRGDYQVEFTLELDGERSGSKGKPITKHVTIIALEHGEDGGPGNWKFKGYVNEGGYIVNGNYCCDSHKGGAEIHLRTVTCACGAVWAWGQFKRKLQECPHCKPKKWNSAESAHLRPVGFAV